MKIRSVMTTNSMIIFLVVAVLAKTSVWAQPPVNITTLYMPKLRGSETLSQNVTTVINLQILRTLRKNPQPNPNNLDFGKGRIVYYAKDLAIADHKRAELMAADSSVDADMVLWGDTTKYGEGHAVQAYLTLMTSKKNRVRNELWTVEVASNNGKFRIVADVPRRQYEFNPIVLSSSLVNKYKSPSALVMYEDRKFQKVIGPVGSVFKVLKNEDGMVLVRTFKGKTHRDGWVPLPSLSREDNELVDFVAGVMKVHRADWVGAIGDFRKVVKSENAPTNVACDAYLYMAFAKAKLRQDGSQNIEFAGKTNELSKGVAVFDIMHKLELLKSAMSRGDRNSSRSIFQNIQKTFNENRYRFDPGDPWFKQVDAVVRQLQV